MKLLENQGLRRKLLINIFFLVFALFSVSRRTPIIDESPPFERFLIGVFAPIQSGIVVLRNNLKDFWKHYLLNVEASKVNVELKKEIDFLNEKIFEGLQTKEENLRLKGLLEFVENRMEKRIMAQIVAFDSSRDYKVIRINKGLRDGLIPYSPVVTSMGLVGYVYRLTDYYADILTILDTNNRVDAIVDRTRTHGILEGYSDDTCLMKYISRSEGIILGDVVLSSGLGRIYPKGVNIGTITRVERESDGITQHVEVTPNVNFARLEEVVVLIQNQGSQLIRDWDRLQLLEEGK